MRTRSLSRLALLLVVVATLAGVRTCSIWLDPFAGRSFNRDVWCAWHDASDHDSPRASMVASLRRNYLKPGLTRKQVVELLGEPDMEKRPNLYEYHLGSWSGFGMDPDGLQIHFDDQGRLIAVECVQH